MAFLFAQFLTGLANAAALFLVASGLSLIFGVTRIVNFAHGSFYMLGAFIGIYLMEILPGAVGFWGAILQARKAELAEALGQFKPPWTTQLQLLRHPSGGKAKARLTVPERTKTLPPRQLRQGLERVKRLDRQRQAEHTPLI